MYTVAINLVLWVLPQGYIILDVALLIGVQGRAPRVGVVGLILRGEVGERRGIGVVAHSCVCECRVGELCGHCGEVGS